MVTKPERKLTEAEKLEIASQEMEVVTVKMKLIITCREQVARLTTKMTITTIREALENLCQLLLLLSLFVDVS